MAYSSAHRTDILVPIMTPTSATHPPLASPPPEEPTEMPPYDPTSEDKATSAILTTTSNAPAEIADLARRLPLSQTSHAFDQEALKLEAQSLIDTNKFTTKKQFRALLDEQLENLVSEVEERARKRSEGIRMNESVEEEIKRLEARYETERRALGKRMIGK